MHRQAHVQRRRPCNDLTRRVESHPQLLTFDTCADAALPTTSPPKPRRSLVDDCLAPPYCPGPTHFTGQNFSCATISLTQRSVSEKSPLKKKNVKNSCGVPKHVLVAQSSSCHGRERRRRQLGGAVQRDTESQARPCPRARVTTAERKHNNNSKQTWRTTKHTWLQ